jgi:hypothetical protein
LKSAPPTAATCFYRALLHLYPSAFRLEFGNEIAADFDDATEEAWRAHGWPGVLPVWLFVGADLARAVLVQWYRTGLPALVVLSASWSTMMFSILAHQYVQLERTLLPIRPTPVIEVLLLIPLGIVPVFVLIMHIHWWLSMLAAKRHSSEC